MPGCVCEPLKYPPGPRADPAEPRAEAQRRHRHADADGEVAVGEGLLWGRAVDLVVPDMF
jgi:hypothetical protein